MKEGSLDVGTGRLIRATAVVGLAGLLLIALFGIATATAPAGNRNPVVELVAFPGPGEVTYQQNVAYTATLQNTQSSTFTRLQFHNPIPTTIVSGSPVQAVLKYASCPGSLSATTFSCNEITLTAGQTAKVTIVWQTPAAGSSSNCPPATPVCMTNTSFWTIKEGTGKTGSSGPDTFPSSTVATSLLVVPDFVEAGGYALTPCTPGGSQTTLATNLSVGSSNPLATKVCASTMPGQLHSPGLSVEIDEGVGQFNLGVTQTAFVCMPGPGGACPETPGYGSSGYTPWTFSPPAEITAIIDNTTLPSGEKIDIVKHDGVVVTSTCTITVDNKAKTTTVSCDAPANGGWDFG